MLLLYLHVLVQMSGPGKWSLLSPAKETGRIGTVSYILTTFFFWYWGVDSSTAFCLCRLDKFTVSLRPSFLPWKVEIQCFSAQLFPLNSLMEASVLRSGSISRYFAKFHYWYFPEFYLYIHKWWRNPAFYRSECKFHNGAFYATQTLIQQSLPLLRHHWCSCSGGFLSLLLTPLNRYLCINRDVFTAVDGRKLFCS